jgi:hypothetical protein
MLKCFIFILYDFQIEYYTRFICKDKKYVFVYILANVINTQKKLGSQISNPQITNP